MFKHCGFRRPAHDRSILLRDGGRILACHLFEHCNLAVPVDELNRNTDVEQTGECFTRHRARNDIAPDHDLVDFCLTNLVEYSLKGGKISMNIVE